MHRCMLGAMGVVGIVVVSGCRTATRMTEMPRVDLELSGGNRGFLAGTPPPAGELKATREMIQTDIEIPSFYKAKRSGAQVGLESIAPPETEPDREAAVPETPAKYDIYVVQKGESLWSIAAKSEIYGKASTWRQIYDANRDQLKSPDQVRAGMTLKIPRGELAGGSTTYSDEGITYKK